MKSLVKLITFGALLFANSFAYSQNLDSLGGAPKSVGRFAYAKPGYGYVAPSIFISYGLMALTQGAINNLDISTRNEIKEDHPNFIAHADDYLKYAPVAAVYGLDLIGIKGKHKPLDQSALMVISMGINVTAVTQMKKWTNRLRPDGSSYSSFPSGHTATVFAAAEFLNQEFKDVSPWYGYGGYFIATATGILRVYNNRHWVSDVVAGAGFGILSTKLGYYIYPHLKGVLHPLLKNQVKLMPSLQMGHPVASLSLKL